MPFPDEPFAQRVVVDPYQQRWASEGEQLVVRLRQLVPGAVAVDHIGSTSVPGLPAKDCLDAMVRVHSVGSTDVGPLLAAGFRERPESWNQSEELDGVVYPKRVFAPPVAGRPVNIHIRDVSSTTARYSLLFRDFLRADECSRDSWGRFKSRLSATGMDIYAYGQVKATVQPLLMALAERWAAETAWRP